MTATKKSLTALDLHARSKIIEMLGHSATHNPVCRCGNIEGAVLAWTALLNLPSEEVLESQLSDLGELAGSDAADLIGPEAGIAMSEVVDEARCVAGAILRADGTIAEPVSGVSWSARRSEMEPYCPRCGRGHLTGSTWPDCARHGDHGTWCQRRSGQLCTECEPVSVPAP